ncbi:MAG TPA: hypothetical protein VD814_09240 [Nocardioides sp.]|nr:hypothetical protein [Nocardioides sp.]
MSMVQRLAAVAGLRVVLVDETARPVPPMRDDAARDRAGRRYPAHVDPTAHGWWMPPGSHLTVAGITACRRSREQRVPQVSYDTGPWRSVLRGLLGTPDDHPTVAELAALVEERTGETTRAGPRRAD